MCSTPAANSWESGMQPHTISTQRHGRPGRKAPITMQKNSARNPVSIRSPTATSANPLNAPNSSASAYQESSLPLAGSRADGEGIGAVALVAGFSGIEAAGLGAGTSAIRGPQL